MAIPDMKAALEASIRGEEQSVADRFAKADAFLNRQGTPPTEGQSTPTAPPPARHEKVIRDGFSMPAADYRLIAEIQAACLREGISLTKSEVLRAGLRTLKGKSLEELKRTVSALTKVKPGRPSA